MGTGRTSAPVGTATRSLRLLMSRSIRDSAARRRRIGRNLARATVAAAACGAATSAAAHGFGQRYDLPLPLSLYLFGTASAVVLSFVVAGLFMRQPSQAQSYPRINLLTFALGRPTRCPEALGVWPAVALLLAFAWIELVFPSPAVPRNIASLAVGYSIITWAGMLMFGRETWLRHGELFTVFFGLVARFAPTEVRVRNPAICDQCEVDCRHEAVECIGCCDGFSQADARSLEWALRPFR